MASELAPMMNRICKAEVCRRIRDLMLLTRRVPHPIHRDFQTLRQVGVLLGDHLY
ncbi:hypothetical protein N9132_01560 [bacterium]|nr:hypothetical protein [bacterium]